MDVCSDKVIPSRNYPTRVSLKALWKKFGFEFSFEHGVSLMWIAVIVIFIVFSVPLWGLWPLQLQFKGREGI